LQDKDVNYLLGSANCAAPAEIRNEAGVNNSGGSRGGSSNKKRNNDGTLKKAEEALDKISSVIGKMGDKQDVLGEILKTLVNPNSSNVPASAALVRATLPQSSEDRFELIKQLEKVDNTLDNVNNNDKYCKAEKKILKKNLKAERNEIFKKLQALVDDGNNDNNSSSDESD